jgi:hypothetical protein
MQGTKIQQVLSFFHLQWGTQMVCNCSGCYAFGSNKYGMVPRGEHVLLLLLLLLCCCCCCCCCGCCCCCAGNGLLAVTGVSKGLLYASCLLFMLPLGSGLSTLTAAVAQKLQQLKASGVKQQPSDGSSDASSSGSGSSYGAGYSSSSGGSSAGAAGGSSSASKGFSLPKLSDASALTLKLAGVLAWPCISAAAVLQPSLLLTANAATGPLAIAAPQVLVCVCLLSLLLTVAAMAGRFGWDVVRRQADGNAVVDFGLQLGLLCGLQAALNVAQLGLSVAGKQLDVQQLGELTVGVSLGAGTGVFGEGGGELEGG